MPTDALGVGLAEMDAPGLHSSPAVHLQNLHSLDSGEKWMHCMRSGDWDGAWRISDAVLRCGRFHRTELPRHQQALWEGSTLERKRVLVHCYHGLGDTVQFIRFASLVRQAAAQVIVWAQAPLIPLLSTARGIDLLLPLHNGAPAVERDVDIEIMELPHALRITAATLPARVPYLHVPGRSRAGDERRPSVGVVFQSGSWDSGRSIPFALMHELMQMDGFEWKILQRGPALSECSARRAQVPRISNLMEEAAELQALDVLVTVDTFSAHLAGALGVRTWTLLPARADWRWMEHREDTPWYPTMRLFRQHRPGDWRSVIARVASALANLRGCREVFPGGTTQPRERPD